MDVDCKTNSLLYSCELISNDFWESLSHDHLKQRRRIQDDSKNVESIQLEYTNTRSSRRITLSHKLSVSGISRQIKTLEIHMETGPAAHQIHADHVSPIHTNSLTHNLWRPILGNLQFPHWPHWSSPNPQNWSGKKSSLIPRDWQSSSF